MVIPVINVRRRSRKHVTNIRKHGERSDNRVEWFLPIIVFLDLTCATKRVQHELSIELVDPNECVCNAMYMRFCNECFQASCRQTLFLCAFACKSKILHRQVYAC